MLTRGLKGFDLLKIAMGARYVLVSIVVIILGLSTLLILSSSATTPTASLETESGTVSSAASTISDTSASGGEAVKFGDGSGANWITGCTNTTGNPDSFPNNCNTGYKAEPGYPGSLTQFTGDIQSNTTYKYKEFDGPTTISGTNITFIGCDFKATAVDNANVVIKGTNINFDYVTIQPNISAPPVSHANSYQYGIAINGGYGSFVNGMTVEHSNIWGFGNAIDMRGSTQQYPRTISDNWIHDPADAAGDYHTDGIGDESGSGNDSYVTINHNTIVSPGNTNGIAFQEGTYSHLTIINNLFGGYGYTIAVWNTSTYITFTGNTYTTLIEPVFGPVYGKDFWDTTGSVWQNNKWLVPSDAAWGNPAHSGWFWLPNDGEFDNQTPPFSDDSQAVSQTDYSGQ